MNGLLFGKDEKWDEKQRLFEERRSGRAKHNFSEPENHRNTLTVLNFHSITVRLWKTQEKKNAVYDIFLENGFYFAIHQHDNNGVENLWQVLKPKWFAIMSCWILIEK